MISFGKYPLIFLSFFGVFGYYLFFSILGSLGVTYSGRDSGSGIFVFFALSIFIFLLIIFAFDFVRQGFSKVDIYFLLFFLFLFINQSISIIINGNLIEGSMFVFQNFIVFGLPGYFAASILNERKLIKDFIKFSDIFAIVLLILLITSVWETFLGGDREVEIGGATYQNFSYMAALSFSILVNNELILNPYERFKIFNSLIFKIILPIILSLAFIACLLGGGRGALIIIIFSILRIIYQFLMPSSFTLRKIITSFTFMFLILIGYIYLNNIILSNEALMFGFDRSTEFVTDEGIDIESGSSGRDIVYLTAIEGIGNSPFFGYGAFNVHALVIHPHNIYLDFFLQFGFLGFLLAVIITAHLIFLAFTRKDKDSKTDWLIWLLPFPMIMLFFSGSYLEAGVFWFLLYLIYSEHYNKKT